MKMFIALVLAATAGFVVTLGVIRPAKAEAGWKLCVAQTCHVNYYLHQRKLQCTNKLVECPTSGEHVGTWTSNEKGSNW